MKKETENNEITRKEAIKKMGKYAAITAVGTFAILSPLRAQNTSQPIDPGSSSTAKEGEVTSPVQTGTTAPTETQVGKTQVESNF